MSFRKVAITLVLTGIVLLSAAALAPFLFKDKILAEVKKSINTNVNAKVNFKEVDFTLISSFPYLGVDLDSLTIAGIDSFATDTLANIPRLHVNLDVMSVIKGESYQIKSVKLQEPRIYARVLKSGKANWDIAKADSSEAADADTSQTKLKAALKNYEIENGRIVYDDASLGFFMAMDSLNHDGDGDFTQDLFTLNTSSTIEKLTVKYAGIPYLSRVKLSADLPIEIDMKQMKFSLGANKINLNELILSLSGSLAMPNADDMLVDVKFNAAQSDLKNFLSLIPALYSSSFKDMNASGKFGFEGKAKGTYNEKSLPAFDLHFLIADGKVKYPGLSSAINNIAVKADIENPDGVLDHTIVNIPSFHLEFGTIPLDGKLLVKNPVSDPFVDMVLKGKLDLKQLTTIFPMQGMNLSGIVDADVKATGNKSSVDKGQYQNFKISGFLVANNFNYSGQQVPMPVSVPSAKVTFNPKNISLTNLSAKVGKSDFQANGTLDNYLEYVFKKDIPLRGKFNVRSGLLDVNELMGPSTPGTSKQADTAKLTVIEVPANIDFALSVNAGRVLYDNYDIQNAAGSLQVDQQTLYFKDMKLDMLDGRLSMNGSYASTDVKKPKVNIDFGIEKMSIQKAFSTFNTIKLLAPVAKYTSGTFSTKLSFNSELDQHMMPLYSSVNVEGITNIIQAIVQGFEPLNKLSLALNTDKLQKLELNNFLTKFKIENGRLNVAPLTIKKGDFSMLVEGFNSLDQSMSYKLAMNVPRAYLGTKVNAAGNALLARFNSKTGSAVELGETVKVNALMTGTVLKPSIKITSVADDTRNEVKTAATQFVDTKKAELQAKAQQEVNTLVEKSKAQAQQRADTLKKQVQTKAAEQIKNKLGGFIRKKQTTSADTVR
ncbi:AsmA family protein [Pedobacter sp. SYSU D00535]|uniref:AsmA family protein n=1 Tax=Pedobacter sp. SYSU D00535 TaxID=2810308 RepID=UPI001A97BA74|nr:AsmA family protein [Pedobacter sp. SYSU D00535]